jgi:AraC-like DNA-binding protein
MQFDMVDAARTYTERPDTARFQMHAHDGYEIFCFLKGKAKYFVEGTVYPLRTGDILIMKKAESHTLLLLNDRPYERMAVHFGAEDIVGEGRERILEFMNGRPLGKGNRFPASVFKDKNWLYYLNLICESESNDVKRLYLTVLLTELCASSHELGQDNVARDNISEVIEYINSHLGDDISLDSICSVFHTSRSHTNRKFRQMTGSSMWKYIKRKRLLMAKELLSKGENPCRVSEKCGFNEYSSFYRAYKSEFGISPKDDHKKL